jgi:hypothetical protein
VTRTSALRPLAIAAALGLAIVGCSNSSDSGSSEPSAAETSTQDAPGADSPPPVPEPFDGTLEAFYEVPDPLPPGEPGDLLRVMAIDPGTGAADAAETSVRVLYRSVDGAGRDRAVSGIVTVPDGPAPDGGWPVLSWAHGTSGLAAPCALSRAAITAPALAPGVVRVATDYIGLGPVGELHPYLSRASEGRSVIDGVRAARHLLGDDEVSARWISAGHSQGGHGAQSAHELAEEHAPELDLLGTVSYAPAAMFAESYGGIDDIVSPIVTMMGVHGLATEHPEVDLAAIVTPEALAVTDVIETACADEVIAALLEVGVDRFWVDDPRTTEPAASIMAANDVGNVAVDAPLLLVSGTADQRVVIERTRALFDRLCDTGQQTELQVVEGATHDDVIARTSSDVAAWMADRLAGAAAGDDCGP